MNIEIRPITEIVYDLLAQARESEWVYTHHRCPRGCCDESRNECPSCGVEEGNPHKDDCQRAALIAEAEAYLQAQEEPIEDTSRPTAWAKIMTEAA